MSIKATGQLTIKEIADLTYEDICTHDTTTGLIECTHAQDQGCVRVTELQGKSEQVQSTLGKNLFDKSKVESGSYLNINNNKIVHAEWGISDFIYVKGLTSIVASGYINLGVSPSTCFYDANKTFISGIPGNDDNSRVKTTVPTTAYYMRFSYTVTALDTLQLESGTTATAYEPFIPNSPSPDYPSVINSVGDSGKLNVVSSVGRRNLIPNTNQGKTGWGYNHDTGGKYSTEDYSALGVNAVKYQNTAIAGGWGGYIYHAINRNY